MVGIGRYGMLEIGLQIEMPGPSISLFNLHIADGNFIGEAEPISIQLFILQSS